MRSLAHVKRIEILVQVIEETTELTVLAIAIRKHPMDVNDFNAARPRPEKFRHFCQAECIPVVMPVGDRIGHVVRDLRCVEKIQHQSAPRNAADFVQSDIDSFEG